MKEEVPTNQLLHPERPILELRSETVTGRWIPTIPADYPRRHTSRDLNLTFEDLARLRGNAEGVGVNYNEVLRCKGFSGSRIVGFRWEDRSRSSLRRWGDECTDRQLRGRQ